MIKPVRYWALLRPEKDSKSWTGSMPDFGILVTGAPHMHAAKEDVERALRLQLRGRLDRGEELPEAGGGSDTCTKSERSDPNVVIAEISYDPRWEKDLMLTRIKVTLTAGERTKIDAHAAGLNISTSEFLRQAGLAAVDAVDKE